MPADGMRAAGSPEWRFGTLPLGSPAQSLPGPFDKGKTVGPTSAYPANVFHSIGPAAFSCSQAKLYRTGARFICCVALSSRRQYLSWVMRYRGHQATPTSHARFAPKATVAGRKGKCSEVP